MESAVSSGWVTHKTPHMIDDTYLVQLSVMLINMRCLTAWGTELWLFFLVEAVGVDFSSGFFRLGGMLPPNFIRTKIKGEPASDGGNSHFLSQLGGTLDALCLPPSSPSMKV